jgi:predicted RNA-binding Zn ribbon-like protein
MTGTHDDPALLLRDFVNTYDVEPGREDLPTPERLAGWLAGYRLVPEGTAATAADLATAIVLRDGLREAMAAHHARRDADLPEELEDALATLPLRLTLTGPRPGLVPLDPPATAAAGLARLAAAITEAAAAGTWPRLKVCQESTCRWAFLDTSKNRSRAWCSMSTCGNRTKTRAYRARRRPPAG